MKNVKGILLIVITTIITFLLWYFAVSSSALIPLDQARHLVAGLALNGFLLNFMLATRNKTLEKWFNGLDKLYIYHKYIAIVTLGLLLVHAFLSDALKTTDSVRTALGGLAMFMLVVLIGITLFDKKLPYEKWRTTHRLMLVLYVISLVHVYISSRIPLSRFTALSVWVGASAVVSLVSAIYIVFFYQRRHFKFKGAVTGLSKLNQDVLEWQITLDKPLPFAQGQFAFVKVFQKELDDAPHPFTISGGEGNTILFTTKISGDFTASLYRSLELQTRVAIDGPYGFLSFDNGKPKQLWVAGGIGVTPFIAYLREDHPDREIDFYYSYRGPEAGVYKELISAYQSKHSAFHVHFIDTSAMPPLSFEGYTLTDDTDVFMCGPAKMIQGYAQYFRRNNHSANISYEAFRLR
ncbi:MAG: ferric reductase-like transmembrane domain-containing protein [Chloroflexi bacterium]|nr:ferric reductase-like transmembrane domain-containing protein [Chloroflexota bacterium]